MGLRGVYPILNTPFTPDGAVDVDSLSALVQHLGRTGLPGFTMFGIASEFYKLSDADRDLIIDRAMAARAPGSTCIISVTAHAWEVAVQQARRAEAAGAEALMLLPPFFLGPSEADLRRHIVQVAGAVALPVMIQYAPAQTGVRLDADFFARVQREVPNACYVKVESQPPGSLISAIRERSEGRVGCLVGYAGLQLPDAMQRGAVGVQPASGVAEVYQRLWALGEAGDWDGLYRLHGELLPLINLVMQAIEPLIRLEKVILRRRGIFASEYCRAAMYEPDAPMLAELDRHVRRIAHYLHPSAPWPAAR